MCYPYEIETKYLLTMVIFKYPTSYLKYSTQNFHRLLSLKTREGSVGAGVMYSYASNLAVMSAAPPFVKSKHLSGVRAVSPNEIPPYKTSTIIDLHFNASFTHSIEESIFK